MATDPPKFERPETLADRISGRLKALGKNPSAVALEAGLGRSSVRDILVGKVTSPRLDTLKRLTGPLSCTLEYLTGDPEEDPDPAATALAQKHSTKIYYQGSGWIPEAHIGVFRTPDATFDDDESGALRGGWPDKKHLLYSDLRFTDHDYELYRITDASLSDIFIVPGDVLTVVRPKAGLIPLKPGAIVVIRRFVKPDESFIEISARVVDVIDGEITLISRSQKPQYKDQIRLGPIPEYLTERVQRLEDIRPNHYLTPKEGVIHVLGFVIRVTRSVDA
jgi:transcriptional regulator with XRE-family HTH domain